MSNHDAPGGDCPPTICSLRKLMERSSEKRKGFFRRYEADPTDIEARDGYFYQEGYNKALLEMAQIIRSNAKTEGSAESAVPNPVKSNE